NRLVAMVVGWRLAPVTVVGADGAVRRYGLDSPLGALVVEEEGRFLAAVRVLRVGDVDIDSAGGGVVRKNGNYVELTDPEKKVLMHWAANYGYPVPRDETVWMVLRDEPDSSNLYGRIVRSLREKVDGSSGLITPVNTDVGPAIRFGPRELGSGEDAVKWVQVGALAIDVVGGEVRKNGEPIELTVRQWKALKYFAKNLRRFLPTDEVKREVWEGQNAHHTSYSYLINRIRVLIGDDPDHPRLLVNTRMGKVHGLRFELAEGHRPQGLEAGGELAGVAKARALVKENARALLDGEKTTAQLFSEARTAGYGGPERTFQEWVFDAKRRVEYAEGDAPSIWSARWKRTGVSDAVLTLLKNKVKDLKNGKVTPADLFDTANENGYNKAASQFRNMLRDLVAAWEAKPDPALWQSALEEPQGLAGGHGPEGLEAGAGVPGVQVAEAAFGSAVEVAEALGFSGMEVGGAGSGEDDQLEGAERWWEDPDYVGLSTPDPDALFSAMGWGPAEGSGFPASAGDEMSVDGEEEERPSAPSAGGEFMLGGGRVGALGGAPGDLRGGVPVAGSDRVAGPLPATTRVPAAEGVIRPWPVDGAAGLTRVELEDLWQFVRSEFESNHVRVVGDVAAALQERLPELYEDLEPEWKRPLPQAGARIAQIELAKGIKALGVGPGKEEASPGTTVEGGSRVGLRGGAPG
ncbi:winged helix-turn-helix domain-containing protein, partial [Actinoallomurus spadix]|uniref:winged helix-turn-helix domain-containing protein n=1 Tax=Actinoallomurus spadix TaxID=79912 RepID=UPI0031DF13EA